MKKYIPILLLLSACGFRPMYTGADTDIYVAPISGINGIELRNELNAKFGGVRDAGAKYTLTVKSYTFVRYLVAANASYNSAVQNTVQVLADKIGTRVITETYRHENSDDEK